MRSGSVARDRSWRLTVLAAMISILRFSSSSAGPPATGAAAMGCAWRGSAAGTGAKVSCGACMAGAGAMEGKSTAAGAGAMAGISACAGSPTAEWGSLAMPSAAPGAGASPPDKASAFLPMLERDMGSKAAAAAAWEGDMRSDLSRCPTPRFIWPKLWSLVGGTGSTDEAVSDLSSIPEPPSG
ncbi:MAG TPA: hypothetical protein DCZ92_06670 [Elusimicrobia bacterium]|nr:hypothetical protein [Elusimicrobiota bacterium]